MKNTYGGTLRENLVQLAAARLVGDLASALKESGHVIVSQIDDEFIIEKGDLQMSKDGIPDGQVYGSRYIQEGALAYEAAFLKDATSAHHVASPYEPTSRAGMEWQSGVAVAQKLLEQVELERAEEKNANPLVDVAVPPLVDANHPLMPVLLEVIAQVTKGKGERHGGNVTPFMDQPWVHYAGIHGRGFLTGQAAKKLEEAASKRNGQAFINEMLGAIAYCGMAIIHEQDTQPMTATGGERLMEAAFRHQGTQTGRMSGNSNHPKEEPKS